MQEYYDNMTFWLISYAITLLIVLIASFRKTRPSVGLPLAYSFNLFMNHYFGGLIHTLPWYYTDDFQYTYLGFEQTFYGFIAFAVSSQLLGPLLINSIISIDKIEKMEPNPKITVRYLQIGLVFYVLLGPILGRIPSIGTFAQSAWYLLITAVCLLCFSAYKERRYVRMMLILFAALIFPFVTSFNSGFLGFGVVALMSIVFFIASFFKPRWVVIAIVFVCIYMGLSVCVTYFRDRNELREAVWYDRQSISERMWRTVESYSRFDFLDLSRADHLRYIDLRLNQNDLVGKAVYNLQTGQVEFSKGKLVLDAIASLVPRFLWPDKPSMQNGSEVVGYYTGKDIKGNTTFGAGQVMEFYVNFGTISVVMGFGILGLMIGFFDYKAAQYLQAGDIKRFAFWFLPALGFMQSGGAMTMVISTVAAAMIFCVLIHQYMLNDIFQMKRRSPKSR